MLHLIDEDIRDDAPWRTDLTTVEQFLERRASFDLFCESWDPGPLDHPFD